VQREALSICHGAVTSEREQEVFDVIKGKPRIGKARGDGGEDVDRCLRVADVVILRCLADPDTHIDATGDGLVDTGGYRSGHACGVGHVWFILSRRPQHDGRKIAGG